MQFHITRTGDTLDTIATRYYLVPLTEESQGAGHEEIADLIQKVGEEIRRAPGNEAIRSGKLAPGQWVFLPSVNGIAPRDSSQKFWQHTKSFLGYAFLLAALCWLIGFFLEPGYQWFNFYFPLTSAEPLGVFVAQTIVARPVTWVSMLQVFVLGELVLFAQWFFGLVRRTAIHSGLVYVVMWFFGSILILLFANSILSFLRPLSVLAPALIDWVDIFVSWTILVGIAYVLVGDNTTPYRIYVKEHKFIYIGFLLTILYTALLLNFTSDSINLRIGGLLSTRQVLTARLDESAASLERVYTLALNLERDLKSGNVSVLRSGNATSSKGCSLAGLDTSRLAIPVATTDSTFMQPTEAKNDSRTAHTTQPELYPMCAHLAAAANANQAALGLFESAEVDELALVEQVLTAQPAAAAAIRFLDSTRLSDNNRPGTSLGRTRVAAKDSLKYTAAIRATLSGLDTSLKQARQVPQSDMRIEYSDAAAIVSNELLPQIERARAAAARASAAVMGVKYETGPIFGGTASLLVLFILFPWFLLLLFFLRKRTNLSAGIVTDLIRLAQNHVLLNRVLGLMEIQEGGENVNIGMRGTDKEQVEQQVELVRAIHLLPNAPGDPITVSETRKGVLAFDIVKRAIADKAFSDLEYILTITLLSAAFAVGWYFVLFPKTSIGLSLLILENSGIVGFASYIVSNLTPITAGFVGAYLWSTYVLLRRYYNGDLYPGAYLAALQRTIMVFILTLVLMVLGNVIYGSSETLALTPGAPDRPATFWSALLGIAFFIGIFPEVGLTFLRDVVNRVFKSTFPSLAERAPLTELDGLNYFIVGRLVEEDVENIQGLATAKIEDLVVNTYFPGKRIVDWIDQAILYIHSGRNGEWFQPLRSVGIRNATDLLDALGDDVVGAAPTKAQKGADEACLQLLVDAVKSAQANDAKPLTREILLEMFDSIWPDPNMEYLLSWQRGKIFEK